MRRGSVGGYESKMRSKSNYTVPVVKVEGTGIEKALGQGLQICDRHQCQIDLEASVPT